MSFNTDSAFILRSQSGELGIGLPRDIVELLEQRGLTVVFVKGIVECYGETCSSDDTMYQKLHG